MKKTFAMKRFAAKKIVGICTLFFAAGAMAACARTEGPSSQQGVYGFNVDPETDGAARPQRCGLDGEC